MAEENRSSRLEAWWSLVWELEPHGILRADARGRIEDCNPAAGRMLGREGHDLVGESHGAACWQYGFHPF